MSSLAFQTHLDQNSTNSNLDFSRDSKSHFSHLSDRKARTRIRDSSHESHSSSHSSSRQWSKNTKPSRDPPSSEDVRSIKPHHSPTAEKGVFSEVFLTQHQARHPEEHYQDRLPDGLRILVTRDFDVGYFLDLSGLTHPDQIRPRLFARLGINEEHHQNWQLFRYSGSGLKKYPLDDSQVWNLCLHTHQCLLLLVLVVLPGRHDPNFINCDSLPHHAMPSNLPYQPRDSQSSASLESSDSWLAPRSPASDMNAKWTINNSYISSHRDGQRSDDRDQHEGVSRPLSISGHSPAPVNHLALSSSRLGGSPVASSKYHVRQHRSTSDSYTLPSTDLYTRVQINTSPRPMAIQMTGPPLTRNPKTDLAVRDKRVTLTSPDLTTPHHHQAHGHAGVLLHGNTDNLRESTSSISPRHSQTNHKLANKTSSAIAFIQSAASKIDNVLFKPKTSDASHAKIPLPNGLVHPTSPSMSGPGQDHIKALPLPISHPSESFPTPVSPGTSAPYEQSFHHSNKNNHSSKFDAQGTAWTHNIAYEPNKVVGNLNSSNTPGARTLEALPQIHGSHLPDLNRLPISSFSSKQNTQSWESVQDEKPLVPAQGTFTKNGDDSLSSLNGVDPSHTGIVTEPESSKDYFNEKKNFGIIGGHQSNTLPALELEPLSWDPSGYSLEGDGEDLKTLTEKRWEEFVKNRPRSAEESQSDSSSCESLNRFSGDHMLGEDDEEFEPSEMFQVEMLASQTKVFEEEIDEADRTSTTREVNFIGRTWAVRPPVDQVYEKLEKSFPYHNLDEHIDLGLIPEFTKEAGLPASPDVPDLQEKKEASYPTPSTPSKIVPEDKSPLIGRARSIRIVAEEQKRLLSQQDVDQTGDPKTDMSDKQHQGTGDTISVGQRVADNKKLGGLSRIKSTKLWGIKTEEVPPLGQGRKQMGDIPRNSPVHGSSRANSSSFKWARGRLIGKGSFGEVYLALNITKGDMLAVKRVKLTTEDSRPIAQSDDKHGKAIAALRSEVLMLKDLEHPNIVQYLGFEETTEFASIFLEYVPGGSIAGCIRAHGAFELQVTKSFTIQTVEGLKYLHHSGILHRDLKSDNILVDLKGNCKIADFGISKVSSKADAYQTNTCMSFKGTAFYMAPEIITNQKGYSAKADIWSLGCVVLEMMCGRRPWSEQNQFQALFKVGSEGVGPPIPGDLELDKLSQHFFQACFSRNPKDRPMADKLSYHLFLTVDPSWCFESSELFRAIGTQKIDELFNE